MNKLLGSLILSLFCLASLPVMAAEEEDHGLGFWAEAGAASGKNHASWLTGYYDHKFTDSLGMYVVVDTESDGYHEWYVGPKIELTKGFEIGIATGRESIRGELPNSPRHNAFASIDTDKVSVYATFERGPSGSWHKIYALYKATETVSAGAMYETNFGIGPRVEYTIAKNVTVWGAVLHNGDTKETTSLLAVNFSF